MGVVVLATLAAPSGYYRHGLLLWTTHGTEHTRALRANGWTEWQ